MNRFRKLYGSAPLHLVALLACFAVIGYAVDRASAGPLPNRMAVWFAGSFLIHDFVLFPLYAVLGLGLSRGLNRGRVPSALLNAVRIPLGLSLLLLLIFQGPIRHQGDVFFHNASGLHETNYLARWLLTTLALFVASAVVYGLRSRRAWRTPVPGTEQP